MNRFLLKYKQVQVNPRWLAAVAYSLLAALIIYIEGRMMGCVIHLHPQFPVQVGQPWYGPILQPLVTLVGGGVALWTYARSHAQQKLHFEVKALYDERSEILARFGDQSSPLTRATALINLQEIALRKWPGPAPSIADDSQPFFNTIVVQLSNSLLLESDPQVLEATRLAIVVLAQRTPKHAHNLKTWTIAQSVATTNADALDMFLECLGRCLAELCEPTEQDIENLAACAPIRNNLRNTAATLAFFTQFDSVTRYRTKFGLLKQVVPRTPTLPEAINSPASTLSEEAINKLSLAAIRLQCTKSALEACLNARKNNLIYAANFDKIQFTGLYLADANLSGTEFTDARIDGSFFAGSNLQRCKFGDSDFQYVIFDDCDLTGSDIDGTVTNNCSFKRAVGTQKNLVAVPS